LVAGVESTSVEFTTGEGEGSSVTTSGAEVGDDAEFSTRSTGGGPVAGAFSGAEVSAAVAATSGELSAEAGWRTDPHVNTNKTAKSSAPAMAAPRAGVDSRRMGREDAAENWCFAFERGLTG
jgi:hypothetical protein